MKKIAIILLVLSTQIVGMEQDNTSWFSWLLSKPNKINIVPEKIALLRKEKSELESKLSFEDSKSKWLVKVTGIPEYFDSLCMIQDPKIFLQSLYYWKYTCNGIFSSPEDVINITDETLDAFIDAERLKIDKLRLFNYTIDGYGPLSAALIASDLEKEKKEDLITRLLHLGFLPTKNDLNLAYLELWERTEKDDEKKFLLCLGNNDPNCILSQLPREIIKIIAQFVTDEDSLLPRKFFENGIVRMQSNAE